MRTDTKLFVDGAVGSEASSLLRGSTAGSVGSSLGGSMGGRGGPEESIGGLLRYWHRCSTNWSAMVGSPTLNYPSKCMKIHEVCALYPPVKEKVHCSAPNSVKNLVMHRIR